MRQRLAILWLTLVIAAFGVIGIAAPVFAGDPVVSATLTGAQEAPGPGDPDGSGTFVGRINTGQGTLCYTLTAMNIQPATAAHVHVGPAGQPGPVVIPLAPPTTGSSGGCVSADRDLLKSIRENPSLFYVNVHNAEFPGGAIRGQLS